MTHRTALSHIVATVSGDLGGRCILFVGGRNRNAAHLRRLVEDRNGRFAYHDGGMEENIGRLGNLLQRADAVLFPVEHVSHEAPWKVKDVCRRLDKPFSNAELVDVEGAGHWLHAERPEAFAAIAEAAL